MVNQRPVRRPVSTDLCPELAAYFRDGLRFWLMASGSDWYRHPDRVRDAWEASRDEILTAWIRKQPGSRPHGWWLYDAPTYRARINGLHRFEDPVRLADLQAMREQYGHGPEWGLETCRGLPTTYFVADDWAARYETETDYLARLSLLTPGEIEALTTESAQ